MGFVFVYGLSGPVWPEEALAEVGLRPRTRLARRGFVGAAHGLSGPVQPVEALWGAYSGLTGPAQWEEA